MTAFLYHCSWEVLGTVDAELSLRVERWLGFLLEQTDLVLVIYSFKTMQSTYGQLRWWQARQPPTLHLLDLLAPWGTRKLTKCAHRAGQDGRCEEWLEYWP